MKKVNLLKLVEGITGLVFILGTTYVMLNV